ncbi:MAG: oligosaccharide flippase family protein [Lachnospiraceae bacterium]|nr:oligosaccharide flippase family protein [Lachnospiraceae bacterium]
MISEHNKKLLSNTGFMYLMMISVQVLNLITIPYLTRTLGPAIYGRIGLAQGYMVYVQIILDFGFILSATQLISENRTDKFLIAKVISSVTLIKIVLSFFVALAFVLLFAGKFFDKTNAVIIIIYLAAYLFNALLPDYYYRGMEDMKMISIRTVLIRIIFTMLIFTLVRSDSDYLYVPISFLTGSIIALLFSIFDIVWKYEVKIILPNMKDVKKLFVISIPFFVSRFASTFYQALDVIIIGKLYGLSPIVGYYSTSDKAITLAKMASSPIADSLYPYMLKNRNFKLVKKMLLFLMPIITIVVVLIGIFAESLCIFAFGDEYAEAGNVLRLLLPIAWVILPTYVIAFPVMSPMGLVKYANYSNMIGMLIQIFGLVIFKLFGYLNLYTICALTSLAEVSVFIYRIIIVLINRRKINI